MKKEIKMKGIYYLENKVQAGFPSPGENYEEHPLDFNEYLIGSKKSSTFAMRVAGSSMEKIGIHEGDMIIVDRAMPLQDNKIVVAIVDGDFTLKRLKKKGNKFLLHAENDSFPPIDITKTQETSLWGVVKHVIKDF